MLFVTLNRSYCLCFSDDKPEVIDQEGEPGIVVPTSDEDAERDLIASEITSFLVSMTLKKEDGRYQCLICARESRDLYNQRQHILTHMAKDGTFAQRLNNYARRYMIEHDSKSFTCLKFTTYDSNKMFDRIKNMETHHCEVLCGQQQGAKRNVVPRSEENISKKI